jgi:hypothetical protein
MFALMTKTSINENLLSKEDLLEEILSLENISSDIIGIIEVNISSNYKIEICNKSTFIKEALEYSKAKEINSIENQIHNLQIKLKKLKS